MLDRFGRIIHQHTEQPITPPPATTPETLGPGDALILEDGRDFLVQSAIDCQEELEGRTTTWRWLLLDDGSLLEVLRHVTILYSRAEILYQGTPPYALLTGQGDQDGLLRVFEARVRAGTIAGMPVIYEHAVCGSEIHQQIRCAACEEQIPSTDIKVRPGPGLLPPDHPAAGHR